LANGALGAAGPADGPALEPRAAAHRAARLTHELEDLAATIASSRGRAGASVIRRAAGVSRARRQLLARLLARDPRVVAHLLLSRRARRILHAVPGSEIEARVSIAGRYRIWHSDDFSGGSRAGYADQVVTSSAGSFVIRPTWKPVLRADAAISVTGYRLDHDLLVVRGGIKALSGKRWLTSAAASATSTLGQVSVAVIGVGFTDSSTPLAMSGIKTIFQGNPGHDAVSYFNDASYGKMTLAPSFYGPYEVGMSTASGCGSSQAQAAAINAASADVDYAGFSRLIFVENCTGLAGFSGSAGPVVTPQGTITASVIVLDREAVTELHAVVHELSHTLAGFLHHAGSYVCLPDAFDPPTRFDPGCVSAEYGDEFDVLGLSPASTAPQLDPFHKAAAGWLDASQFPRISAPGTYTFTLAPYEQTSPTGQPLALDIPRGNTGADFTVEYRQPIGFDLDGRPVALSRLHRDPGCVDPARPPCRGRTRRFGHAADRHDPRLDHVELVLPERGRTRRRAAAGQDLHRSGVRDLDHHGVGRRDGPDAARDDSPRGHVRARDPHRELSVSDDPDGVAGAERHLHRHAHQHRQRRLPSQPLPLLVDVALRSDRDGEPRLRHLGGGRIDRGVDRRQPVVLDA